jgi:probable HAF family extracellular repeat protein
MSLKRFSERARSTPVSSFRWSPGRGAALLGALALLTAVGQSGVAARTVWKRPSKSGPRGLRRLQAADSYQARDLGSLPGFDESRAEDLNDEGVVVGTVSTGLFGERRAAAFFQGKVTDLNDVAEAPPGVVLRAARGVNNNRDVVGETTDSDVYRLNLDSGEFTPIPELSLANDINNNGQIVGIASNGANTDFAALWENGQVTDLNNVALGQTDLILTEATGINDNGQVVGIAQRSFIDEEGNEVTEEAGFLLDLNTQEFFELVNAVPSGIGNGGEIVGTNLDEDVVLDEDGHLTFLDEVVSNNVLLFDATGINARGQISATGNIGGNSENRALLLTPGGGGELAAEWISPITVQNLVRTKGFRRGGSGLGRLFGSQLRGTLQVSNPGEERFPGGLVRFYLSEDEELGPGDRLLQTTPLLPIDPAGTSRVRLAGLLRRGSRSRGAPDVSGQFVIAVVIRDGEEVVQAVSDPIGF